VGAHLASFPASSSGKLQWQARAASSTSGKLTAARLAPSSWRRRHRRFRRAQMAPVMRGRDKRARVAAANLLAAYLAARSQVPECAGGPWLWGCRPLALGLPPLSCRPLARAHWRSPAPQHSPSRAGPWAPLGALASPFGSQLSTLIWLAGGHCLRLGGVRAPVLRAPSPLGRRQIHYVGGPAARRLSRSGPAAPERLGREGDPRGRKIDRRTQTRAPPKLQPSSAEG